MLVLAFTFVVPLDTSQGQHPSTLAQDINNLISTGQFSGVNTGVNTAEHIATPTFSPPLPFFSPLFSSPPLLFLPPGPVSGGIVPLLAGKRTVQGKDGSL